MDYGFANYTFEEIKADLKEKEVLVEKGEFKSVKVEAKGNVSFLCEKAQKGEITKSVEWQKDIKAPIKKGQTVGYVNIYCGNENIGRIPITADQNLKKRDFLLSLGYILNGMFKI